MTTVISDCLVCGGDIEFTAPEELKYLDEFGQYENVQRLCPHCEAAGKDTLIVLNMNIPPSEFAIEELEHEIYFLPGEKERREAARVLMWAARPDLKGKDRAAYDREVIFQTEQYFGKSIEQIRQENERIKELEMP